MCKECGSDLGLITLLAMIAAISGCQSCIRCGKIKEQLEAQKWDHARMEQKLTELTRKGESK